ncbi:MAG: hypothetical protein KDK38_04015 [Leptospiraceae bacterium]|nr:hypothetical protein [Leptospiraceae bacterium]
MEIKGIIILSCLTVLALSGCKKEPETAPKPDLPVEQTKKEVPQWLKKSAALANISPSSFKPSLYRPILGTESPSPKIIGSYEQNGIRIVSISVTEEDCNGYGFSNCVNFIEQTGKILTDAETESWGKFKKVDSGYALFGFEMGEGDGCSAHFQETLTAFHLESSEQYKLYLSVDTGCSDQDCLGDSVENIQCREGSSKTEKQYRVYTGNKTKEGDEIKPNDDLKHLIESLMKNL